jgi:hypothetical protein
MLTVRGGASWVRGVRRAYPGTLTGLPPAGRKNSDAKHYSPIIDDITRCKVVPCTYLIKHYATKAQGGGDPG